MALQVRRNPSLKVRVITTLMMVFALVVQPLYGFASAHVANALSSGSIVCDSLCTAETIQAAIDAALPGESITFAGNASISRQLTLNKDITINGAGFIISPTFTKTDNGNNAAIGVIGASGVVISNLKIDGTGGTTLHGINVYESTAILNNISLSNSDRDGLVVNSSTVTVNNIATSGNGWGGIDVDQGSSSRSSALTINGQSLHTETNSDVRIDNVTKSVSVVDTNAQYRITPLGNLRIFKLKPVTPKVAACVSPISVHSTDLSKWNRTETRNAGHNSLVADGLRIWTDAGAAGSPDPRKAAGYYATDFSLKDIGDLTIAESIDYQATQGITPGLQLIVDFDNNGTPDGILVGEAIYGNNWWLTGSAQQFVKDLSPNNGGGNGSIWYGTPNEWLSSFPDAKIKSIGYSLGSGVNGDGVIKRISLGCVDYTFGLDTVAPEAPAVKFKDASGIEKNNGGWSTTETFAFNLSNPLVDETTRYQVKYWNDISGSSYKSMENAWNYADLAGYSSSLGVYNDRFSQGEGKHYFAFSACDAANNCSAYSAPFVVNYDQKAPSTPAGLKLYANNIEIKNGYTKSYDVTAKWSGSTDNAPVTYDYKYWNTIEGSAYNRTEAAAEFWNVGAATQNYGVFNQGEGQHYLAVRAVDAAGNKSAWTAPYPVIYDKTSPSIMSSSDKDTVVSGAKTFNISQSEANPSTLYVEYMEKDSAGIWRKKVGKEFSGNNASLTVDTTKWNNGPHQIKVTSKDKSGNQSGDSFTFTVNNPQPIVTGDNFNTHSGTDYKGINVGFNIANFKTVTGVSVSLYDKDGKLLTTNTHNDKLLRLINVDGVKQLSTPFIITPGTYEEEFWNLGSHTWTRNDKPAKAVVTVSGINNANVAVTANPVELALLSEANDVSFASLLPVIDVNPVTPPADDTRNEPVAVTDNGTLPLIVNQLATASPLIGNGTVFGAVFTGSAFTSADEQAASDENAAVLGTQTTKADSEVSDLAKNVAVIEPTSEGWKLFGLAWYWLALLIAAIAAIWYAVARRRNQDV